MKLGRLLLKGFRKKPGKKSRAHKKNRTKTVSGALKRGRRPVQGPLAFLRLETRKVELDVPESKPGSELAPPAKLPETPTVVQDERPIEVMLRPRLYDSGLDAVALVHPDERLRRSIEGFLLDQRSEHTRRAYGKDLQRFVKFLVARGLRSGPASIDRRTLIGYKDALLSEGLEHTTIDRHLATLRSFFRWLVDDGIIEKNPAEGVRFMNPKRISRTNGFSDEEVVKILSKPNLHTRTGSQHYAILMVLFYCGLRRSELCELRHSSIGQERGQYVFRLRGKGNLERVIVIVPPVWNALEHFFRIARKNLEKDEPLFTAIRNNRTGERGKPLDPSMIFYIVTKYARLAGVANRVSPHSCRATAISNARDRHVPDRAIQEFAGWSSPDMITRYDKRKTAVEDSAAHAIRYGEREREIPEWQKDDAASPSAPGRNLAES